MTDPHSPATNTDMLPRHTTPTWEVELLISGVAVFAMLQLPGWLNARALAMLPRFDANWAMPLSLLFTYLSAVAILLAVTFALHLLLRAQWIALVGMHSVYPDGVLWDRLRIGPVQRAVERQRNGDAATVIERADNRATTVFAIGVTLASNLLVGTMLYVLLFGIVICVAWLLGVKLQGDTAMLLAALLLVVPVSLLPLLDRWLGARLREQGRAWRLMAATHLLYSRIGLGRGGVQALLASHGGERRYHLLTGAVMVVAILVASSGYLAQRLPYRIGSYALFPQFSADSAHAIDAAHYGDLRNPDSDVSEPYVQGTVIAAPYLHLTVPYDPDRDPAALRRDCAPALAAPDTDSRAARLLACLTRLHVVSLDGKPLTMLHYAAGSDARSGRPALVAMIDVRALAPGRHQLKVMRVPVLHPMETEHDKVRYDVIPFWR